VRASGAGASAPPAVARRARATEGK